MIYGVTGSPTRVLQWRVVVGVRRPACLGSRETVYVPPTGRKNREKNRVLLSRPLPVAFVRCVEIERRPFHACTKTSGDSDRQTFVRANVRARVVARAGRARIFWVGIFRESFSLLIFFLLRSTKSTSSENGRFTTNDIPAIARQINRIEIDTLAAVIVLLLFRSFFVTRRVRAVSQSVAADPTTSADRWRTWWGDRSRLAYKYEYTLECVQL